MGTISESFGSPQDARCCIQEFDNPVQVVDAVNRGAVPSGAALGALVPPPANINFNPTVGNPVVVPIEFVGEAGKNIPAELTVAAVPNSSLAGQLTLTNTGGFSNSPGQADYLLTVNILPDSDGNIFTPKWIMIAGSVGPQEAFAFFASNPVTEYQHAGGINISGRLPYTGGWHNNNAGASAAFGFAEAQSLTFRTNGAAGVSSGFRIGLRDVPRTYDYELCTLPDTIRRIIAEQAPTLPAVPGTMPMVSATPSGEGNGGGEIIALTQVRADQGWAVLSNELRYNGAPDRVRIDAHVFYDNTLSGAEQRVSPELELLKNGAIVARSATGYQRHASAHEDSSNAISWVDPAPGANPVYALRSQQGSDQTDPAPIGTASFSAEAIQN